MAYTGMMFTNLDERQATDILKPPVCKHINTHTQIG